MLVFKNVSFQTKEKANLFQETEQSGHKFSIQEFQTLSGQHECKRYQGKKKGYFADALH